MKLPDNRDLWTGIMFIAVGAAAMFIASDYRFGSVRSMGSGFFPMILGGLLIGFGCFIAAKGLRNKEKIKARVWTRPLILLPLSFIVFGKLMETAGYIPALVALIALACAAGPEFKIREMLVLAVVLSVISVAVFIWGLGLSYPLFGAA